MLELNECNPAICTKQTDFVEEQIVSFYVGFCFRGQKCKQRNPYSTLHIVCIVEIEIPEVKAGNEPVMRLMFFKNTVWEGRA